MPSVNASLEAFQALHPHVIGSLIRGGLWICVGIPLLFFFARVVGRSLSKRISPHAGMLAQKIISYGGNILIFITILLDFNFNLSAILGTAGIASVAFGFAAKTSLSNLISGVFLLWEKPFQIGDQIRIDKSNITGYVLSIDLLSVKIRTQDNLFVRIPNETLVQSDFVNISRFPIRRYALSLNVAYNADLKRVEAVLIEVALANACCLDDPAPQVLFDSLGASGINYTLYVWVEQSRYNEIRNLIAADVVKRFAQEGIEIPYTRYDVKLLS